MKKLLLPFFIMFAAVSFAAAAGNHTPASIYAKIIEKSYIGKYQSIIIDKDISSTQLPDGTTVKSRTYFAGGKFREETKTKNASGQTMNIVTIFTPADTFVSYDAGENFFSLGISLIDEISSSIKNIEPFTPLAVLRDKTEIVNGAECYVIEDESNGMQRRMYVEKKTSHLVKSVVSGEDMLIITELSDYRKVDKYTAPFLMNIIIKQKTGEKQTIESTIKITSIQFNPAINADIFIPKNVTKLPNIPGLDNIQDIIQSLF
ncbi:MAG: outer membrane lipoprotein-sorting protein [Endomicrobia bacterium]|nr:outer membrane lipoprotein-sorting protein [Bacillota bacterium]MCL1971850.1 outer membrane lipoprotein-sorting protein [Endomicrobiia bacterium]